jgi:hypothetical protein
MAGGGGGGGGAGGGVSGVPGSVNGLAAPNAPNASNKTTTTLYFSREKVFTIQLSGLKPETRHYFYLGNIDKSQYCTPISPTAGAQGSALLTGTDGRITFTFAYQDGLPDSVRIPTTQTISTTISGAITFTFNFNEASSLLNSLAGNKVFTVKSLDNSSSASVIVPFIRGIADLTGVNSMYRAMFGALVNNLNNNNTGTETINYRFINGTGSIA